MFNGQATPEDLSLNAVTFIKCQELYYREKVAKLGQKITELNKKLKNG